MKKIFLLAVIVFLMNVMASAQVVNLICVPGEYVVTSYTGGMGRCVTIAPSNGNIRYAFGPNCGGAINDPVAAEIACECCPVFTSDCILYTNVITSATSDQFVIGEITYNITIPTTLPVRLTNLKAYELNSSVQVAWTIQQENNINRYELERSHTGEQFVKVSALPSKGNSEIMQNYALTDPDPMSGTNFYRIKAVARSGESTYSQVVKVNRNAPGADVSVAPNPLTGNNAVLHYTLPKGNYTINIISGSGQQVFTKSLQHGGGSAAQTITFPGMLAPGFYRMKLAGEGFILHKKILK
jgi:hypothetical protein